MIARRRKFHRRRGFPAAAILIALAVFPLVGVLALSARSIRDASSQRAEISTIEDAAQDAILLGELRVAIFVERNWALGINGILDLGLPQAEASSFLGFDLQAEERHSAGVTDELLTRIGQRGSLPGPVLADVQSEIVELRHAGLAMQPRFERYHELQQALDHLAAASFRELDRLASDLPDGHSLVSALRALEAAAEIQVLILEQQSIFVLNLLHPGDVSAEQYSMLIEHRAATKTEMAAMRTFAVAGSEAEVVLARLEYDDDAEVFRAAIDSLLARVLDDGVATARRPNPTLLSLMASDAISVFRASLESGGKHSDLMFATAVDLTQTAEDLHQRNRTALWEATVIGMLFAIAAVTAIVGSIRSIVKPLNRLAGSAQQLIQGDLVVQGREFPNEASEVGPAEVRSATRAMHEAAAHLRLIERQALALSEGKLEDDSLEDVAPGKLGESMHQAVVTLARSIRHEESSRLSLAHEATHDGLTQLANRSASVDQITTSLGVAAMQSNEIAVLFLDLDGFKQVNDRLGHRAGDQVLIAVADRLRAAVRPGDHVGRLGGDEFVIIAESAQDIPDVSDMASRLIREIARPIPLDDQEVRIGVSIGLTMSSAYDSPTASRLLGDADMAVYRAKDLGRGHVVVCNEELRQKAERDLALTHALREGLANGEFLLHYQAAVSPDTGAVRSLEALVRWDRPGHGLLTAEAFIDFASQSSLIVELDQLALDLALHQLSEWTNDPVAMPIAISVNISGRSLATPDFVALTLSRIERAGVSPDRIIVEVKEDVLFADVAVHGARLQQLREAGVKVAIDNFGTGYSSLTQLRRLPIDTLKIDGSFVARVLDSPADEALVRVLIDTAHVLGASVLAEGVETQAQADQMRRLGSGQLQGYLFSQPKPGAEVLDALNSRTS